MLKFPSKLTLSTHARFILLNTLLAIAVASRYFSFLPELPNDGVGILFLLAGTLSQMALLTAVIGVLALPLLLLPTKISQFLVATTATLGISLLIIDTLVFAQYRFHINAVVVDLILAGQIVSFPLITWFMAIAGFGVLWIGEWLTLRWCNTPWRTPYLNRCFLSIVVAALLSTHVLHIWAAANAYQPITQLKRYLPLFYPATANRLMQRYGLIDETAIAQQKTLSLKEQSDLRYPTEPLTFAPTDSVPHILLLVIDSWRADTFNADNTPNLWAFSQSGIRFEQHMSTGNATRAGIFGLFYGIPGTYWHAMLANTQSPLLIDRLQQLNYQMGIFAAAQLRKPEFDKTVFAQIENLRQGSEGNTPAERDANLVEDWRTWYNKQDKNKPVFSFLFFDSPHGYDFPADYPHTYKPMLDEINYLQLNKDSDPLPFKNRYRTSVHYVDSLAKEVLTTLRLSGELDNTIVIITGDHGQEINDNHLNYWGHNSNYTDVQVKVPFAMVGMDINNNVENKGQQTLTSHQDLVPTLFEQYLGVTSPIADYSVGQNLLQPLKKRPFVIASDYNGYALITEDSILEVGAAGQYQLLDKTNRPLKNQQPNFENMQQGLEQLSRFNQ